MLYLKTTRTSLSGLGPLFDAANPAMHVERRTVSTVAPQALFLLNDPSIAEAAKQVTQRSEISAEPDLARRIELLYKLVLGRVPSAREIEIGRTFVERTAEPLQREPGSTELAEPWAVYVQALLLSNEFLFLD